MFKYLYVKSSVLSSRIWSSCKYMFCGHTVLIRMCIQYINVTIILSVVMPYIIKKLGQIVI